MRAYLLGAGASHPVYPLGGGLLQAVDRFIKDSGPCIDRFDYEKDWPRTLEWLEENSNALIREAYRAGNIEQIFTILDFAKTLHDESLISIMRASRKGREQVVLAEANYKELDAEVREYQHIRNTLLWALEAFFLQQHQEDYSHVKTSPEWANLNAFAELLQPGDIVITFNYDSTIERVLLERKKWSPKDGYGTELVFQKSRSDATPVTFPASAVRVLHLHGAIGWYRKPHVRGDYPLEEDGGAIPREAPTRAPLDTEISLDPLLLQGLGIFEVDASMPDRPPNEYQILLHPSFLKDYTGEETGAEVFVHMWRGASQAIREAEDVTVIGYSLPPADSAAWTLLVTSCDPARTTIVNPDSATMARYRKFLRLPVLPPSITFETWLKSQRRTTSPSSRT